MAREVLAWQPLCAGIDGFNLHAAVRCEANAVPKLPWREQALAAVVLTARYKRGSPAPSAFFHAARASAA